MHYLIAKDTLDVTSLGTGVSMLLTCDGLQPTLLHPSKARPILGAVPPAPTQLHPAAPSCTLHGPKMAQESIYQMLERKQHDVGLMLDGHASRLGAEKVGTKAWLEENISNRWTFVAHESQQQT